MILTSHLPEFIGHTTALLVLHDGLGQAVSARGTLSTCREKWETKDGNQNGVKSYSSVQLPHTSQCASSTQVCSYTSSLQCLGIQHACLYVSFCCGSLLREYILSQAIEDKGLIRSIKDIVFTNKTPLCLWQSKHAHSNFPVDYTNPFCPPSLAHHSRIPAISCSCALICASARSALSTARWRSSCACDSLEDRTSSPLVLNLIKCSSCLIIFWGWRIGAEYRRIAEKKSREVDGRGMRREMAEEQSQKIPEWDIWQKMYIYMYSLFQTWESILSIHGAPKSTLQVKCAKSKHTHVCVAEERLSLPHVWACKQTKRKHSQRGIGTLAKRNRYETATTCSFDELLHLVCKLAGLFAKKNCRVWETLQCQKGCGSRMGCGKGAGRRVTFPDLLACCYWRLDVRFEGIGHFEGPFPGEYCRLRVVQSVVSNQKLRLAPCIAPFQALHDMYACATDVYIHVFCHGNARRCI